LTLDIIKTKKSHKKDMHMLVYFMGMC